MVFPTRPRAFFDRAALSVSAAVDGMEVALERLRLAERKPLCRDLIEMGEEEFGPIARGNNPLSSWKNEGQLHNIKALNRLLDVGAGRFAGRHQYRQIHEHLQDQSCRRLS